MAGNGEQKALETERPLTFVRKVFLVISSIVITLGTLLAMVFGVPAWIDSRIKATIEEPAFISQLSRSLRPSVVFDDKGSILADLGAMRYINDIEVTKVREGYIEVVVSPSEHLGVEPVLEALDGDFIVQSERARKYDWIFRLYQMEGLSLTEAPKRERLRFRLEITR